MKTPVPRPRPAMVAPIVVLVCAAVAASTGARGSAGSAGEKAFRWPGGKRAALSLTFDDARPSQLREGVPLFAERGVRVTFYLSPGNIAEHGPAWRRAAEAGHELGNHSMTHPCSGNFPWARERALEEFTLDRMRAEMADADRAIAQQTGVKPATFAYPCGQTFVGRGTGTQSYVPLAAELFVAARGWKGESPNDPAFVDLAQVLGHPMDEVEYHELAPIVDDAIARGQWLVLAGHDIGSEPGPQVTRVSMLRTLLDEVARPERGVWLDTVRAVADHIRLERGTRRP